MKPFMLIRGAMSRWITDSDEVARAVLHAGTGGTVASPATNRDIIAAAVYQLRTAATASSDAGSRVGP